MQRIPTKGVPPIYWHTNRGKSQVQFTYTMAMSVVAGIQYLPHTFMISKYQSFLQHYSNSAPTEVSAKVMKRFEECKNMLQLDQVQQKYYVPYTITGFCLYTIGSSLSRFGARIGIPICFNYEKESDINKYDILVGGNPVDWGSEPGEQLANSLILPENAQKYAILREIFSAQTYKTHFNTLNIGWSSIITYALSAQANHRLDLFKKPMAVRFTFYGLATLFSMGLYYLTKDSLQVYYDNKIDSKIVELGPEMVKGGLEYYEKSIMRNIALRSLLGKSGEKQFSSLGNENFLFRQKCMPLTDRRDFFANILKEDDTNPDTIQ